MEQPLTIGEDFQVIVNIFQVYFALIGSHSEYDLHHPQYKPDERILEKKYLSILLNL